MVFRGEEGSFYRDGPQGCSTFLRHWALTIDEPGVSAMLWPICEEPFHRGEEGSVDLRGEISWRGPVVVESWGPATMDDFPYVRVRMLGPQLKHGCKKMSHADLERLLREIPL